MPQLNNKKLAYAAAGILTAAILVFLVVRGLMGGTATAPSGSGDVPEYVLGAGEEQSVREFVQNFVSLYNTYSTDDFSNMEALGDYETLALRQQTAEKTAQLAGSLPSGYSVRTEALPSTFRYKYPEADRLETWMEVTGEEDPGSGETEQFSALAAVVLVRVSGAWAADSILIEKH